LENFTSQHIGTVGTQDFYVSSTRVMRKYILEKSNRLSILNFDVTATLRIKICCKIHFEDFCDVWHLRSTVL